MKLELYDSNQLNFVELNITGSNNDYIPCDKESKFIDSVVFDVFMPAFENANKLYDYVNPTKYNSRRIIPLRNELIIHIEKLKKIKSSEDFVNFFKINYSNSDFYEAFKQEVVDCEKDWQIYSEALLKINQDLIDLTEKCAGEEKILWVIGY